MTGLFDLDSLAGRLRNFVARNELLKPETARLLEEALIRGEFERGEAARITGLPERTARRVLDDTIALGLLGIRNAERQALASVSGRHAGRALPAALPQT